MNMVSDPDVGQQAMIHGDRVGGAVTLAAAGTVVTGGALIEGFSATGIPGFYTIGGVDSGLTLSSITTAINGAGGYIMGQTPIGQFLNNSAIPWINTNLPTFSSRIVGTINAASSYVYANVSVLNSSSAIYAGTGNGYYWLTYEQPVLSQAATTIITVGVTSPVGP
jgi:hypothetical protein